MLALYSVQSAKFCPNNIYLPCCCTKTIKHQASSALPLSCSTQRRRCYFADWPMAPGRSMHSSNRMLDAPPTFHDAQLLRFLSRFQALSLASLNLAHAADFCFFCCRVRSSSRQHCSLGLQACLWPSSFQPHPL